MSSSFMEKSMEKRAQCSICAVMPLCKASVEGVRQSFARALGTHRFQRALGKRLIEKKLVTCREHAGSDAYPGVFPPRRKTLTHNGPTLCQADPHLLSEFQDVLFAFFVLRR